MQVKGYFNFNVWFVIAIGLIVAFIVSACDGKKACPVCPEAPNPLCVLTNAIEEGSTCLTVKDPNGVQYEAKVTLEDKTELYCQIVKKQGLVCKPVKDSPQTTGAKEAARAIQEQVKAQGSGAGSGSAAPPSPPAKAPAAPPAKPASK